MSLVLEYAGTPPTRSWDSIPRSIGITLLTFAHLHLCWQISRFMLVPICERLGQQFTAWTPIAWLPGCMISLNISPVFGTCFMFLNSLLAGCLLQDVLCRYHDGRFTAKHRFFRDSRAYLTLLLWCGWLPVPSALCFMYQFGRWANHQM